MRSRNIKPGFYKNDLLAECEPLARILFTGLWCMADREGRLEYRPKKIKAELLPYDNCNIEKLIKQLSDKKFIVMYSVSDENYIEITNFTKHQTPHIKEQASTIPAPDKNQTGTSSESLIPDSGYLIPDSITYMSDSVEVGLSEFLYQKIISRNPKFKKPNIQTWAKNISLMIKQDARAPDDIKAVIEWCQGDSFWQNNILSTDKLRKQYDQLYLKMRGSNGTNSGRSSFTGGTEKTFIQTGRAQSDGNPYPEPEEY